jgi:hypothetical protein
MFTETLFPAVTLFASENPVANAPLRHCFSLPNLKDRNPWKVHRLDVGHARQAYKPQIQMPIQTSRAGGRYQKFRRLFSWFGEIF